MSDIEGAVDKDVEGEPASGAEFENPDASFVAITKRHEPNTGGLLEPADPTPQFGLRDLIAPKVHRIPTFRRRLRIAPAP
jgi:hypothetical protein